jgi:surface polysaccharide O-acyltransferase-like enzyme
MRIAEIDALKGIAMIGVLFAHMSFTSRFDGRALEVVEIVQFFLGWCVMAFFWASGFLSKDAPQTEADVRRSIAGKFKRLLVPCFIFSITYKIFRIGLSATGCFSWETPLPSGLSDALQFLLWPIGPQFYFLHYLFGLSVMFAVLRLRLSPAVIYVISLMVFAGAHCFMGAPARGYGPDFRLLPYYVLSYVSGAYFRSADGRGETRILWTMFVVALIASVIDGRVFPFYIMVPMVVQHLLRMSPSLARWVKIGTLGEYSAGIFVWHAPILMPVISIVCARLIGGGPVVIFAVAISTIIASVLLSMATVRFRVLKPWRF